VVIPWTPRAWTQPRARSAVHGSGPASPPTRMGRLEGHAARGGPAGGGDWGSSRRRRSEPEICCQPLERGNCNSPGGGGLAPSLIANAGPVSTRRPAAQPRHLPIPASPLGEGPRGQGRHASQPFLGPTACTLPSPAPGRWKSPSALLSPSTDCRARFGTPISPESSRATDRQAPRGPAFVTPAAPLRRARRCSKHACSRVPR